MCEPPGRTLSQNDWPETTGKLTRHCKTQDREAGGGAVLQGSPTLLLSARRPFIKSLALSARVSLETAHFRVLDNCPVSGPGGG